MSKRALSFVIATICYALLLGLAALLLPDPRLVIGGRGFHASIVGALIAGAVMALLLSGIRTWLTTRISGTGFNWPTIGGGLLAVVLVLLVANGLLWENTFAIRGILAWVVTSLVVWLGTFVFDRIDNQLIGYTQDAVGNLQGHVTAVRQNLPPSTNNG
jgi:MFS family permease